MDMNSWEPSFIDATAIDCITYNIHMDLTLIGILPNELLLEVGEYLYRDQIARLARVCRRLRALAQRLLYVRLGFGEDGSPHKLHMLLSTLKRRPDIAKMVRSINLRPSDCYFRMRLPMEAGLGSGVTPLQSTFEVQVPDRILAGMIIHLLPNLDALSLALPHSLCNEEDDESGWSPTRYLNPVATLFGEDIELDSKLPTTLSCIPGFANLREFEYEGWEFHWSLACLPSLEHISLGAQCKFEDEQAPDGVCTAQSVSLKCRLSVLNPEFSDYRSLEPFLSHFPYARKLELQIRGSGTWHPTRAHPGDFSVLINRLSAMRTSLYVLDLFVDNQKYYSLANLVFPYSLPIHSLRDFSNLKYLKVPFEAIIDGEDIHGILDPRPLYNVIPDSLEILELQFPTLRIWPWLRNFLDKRQERCAKLSSIKLLCSGSRGTDYETFTYARGMYPVINHLRDAFIAVTFHCRRHEWRSEWDDSAYDPVAKTILEHIKSVSMSYRGDSINPGEWKSTLGRMIASQIKESHMSMPSRWIIPRNLPQAFRYAWIGES